MNCLRACNLMMMALAALAVGSQTARATYVGLGPAVDYNVFVFGDNTQFGTDAEGRVAVGGNANFSSGYTVGGKEAKGTDNLVVGGNLTNNGNTVKGGVLVNGTFSWPSPTITGRLNVNGGLAAPITGGTVGGPINIMGNPTLPGYYPPNANPATITALPFNFATVKSYLQGESSYLASLTPNGTTTIFFQQVKLEATGPQGGVYIFNVTGQQMADAAGHGLSITAPANSTVIVNVSGASSAMQNMGISLNGVDNKHVLYNFSQATSLLFGGIGIEGSVLAPNAAVNFANGNLNGTLIAQSVSGNGESHKYLFQGNLPNQPIPEPSTVVLVICGVLAAGGLRAWRRLSGSRA